MRFDELQQAWEELGEKDPLWAVLTVDEMRGNKWNPEAFFKTGVEFIDGVRARLAQVGLSAKGKHAVDFGCGVGRLTQALAPYYETVTGVDISAPMIEKANEFNHLGDRVRFVVNAKPDLGIFQDGSLDYVQTFIVLQHMHPRHQAGYMREFARILRPGGTLVFQIPSADIRPYAPDRNDSFLDPDAAIESHVGMRMFATPAPLVFTILDDAGIDVVGIDRDDLCGPEFQSYTYYCTRREDPKARFMAVDGFAESMQGVVLRTVDIVMEDPRYRTVDLKSVTTADPNLDPVHRQLEALRREHEAVLNSKVWRVGRHLAAVLHRLPWMGAKPKG